MQYSAEYRRTHVELETRECTLPEDERARIQEGLDLIAEEVVEFPASNLWLKIVYHPDSQQYHARAKLQLPGETIITDAYSPWLDESLQHSFDKIRRRIEQYKGRQDDYTGKLAPQQAAPSAVTHVAVPTDTHSGELGEAVLRGDFRAFRLALADHEGPLRTRVAQWVLRYPDVDAMVGTAFDQDDIVEEVFLWAFEDYPDRPKETSLTQWLNDFIDPAVKALRTDPEAREAASFARTLSTPD